MFTIAAGGNPAPTIQWQTAPKGTTNFTNINGATTAQLTVPNVDQTLDGQLYQAVLTNSQGSITSNSASLNVAGVPLAVTLQPVDQTVNANDTVTFTANFTGATSLNWRVKLPNGSYADAGSTTNTLTFQADPSQSGNQYFLVAQNQNGFNTSVTNSATLTVNAQPTAPVVVAQPTDTTATAGNNATVTADATGFPDASVQWQDWDPNAAVPQFVNIGAKAKKTKFRDIAGGTAFTLTLPVTKADNGKRIRAIITNGNGSVTTQVITLKVNTDPVTLNDYRSLQSSITAAEGAVAGCQQATAQLVSNLQADLKRLDAPASAKHRLALLAQNETASRTAFAGREKAMFTNLSTLMNSAYQTSQALASDPSNTTLSGRLRSLLKKLTKTAAGSTAPADATECNIAIKSQLAPISRVKVTDTSLQSHIADAYTGAGSISQALQAPVKTALAIVQRFRSNIQS